MEEFVPDVNASGWFTYQVFMILKIFYCMEDVMLWSDGIVMTWLVSTWCI